MAERIITLFGEEIIPDQAKAPVKARAKKKSQEPGSDAQDGESNDAAEEKIPAFDLATPAQAESTIQKGVAENENLQFSAGNHDEAAVQPAEPSAIKEINGEIIELTGEASTETTEILTDEVAAPTGVALAPAQQAEENNTGNQQTQPDEKIEIPHGYSETPSQTTGEPENFKDAEGVENNKDVDGKLEPESTTTEIQEEKIIKKEKKTPKANLPEDWEGDKQYYSIGEVATLFNVKTSHIRFWTNEFKLKVRTNRKGDRLFTSEQIKELRAIHHLVKERGFTLSGAKAKLKAPKSIVVETIDLKQSLSLLKDKLLIIRNQLV